MKWLKQALNEIEDQGLLRQTQDIEETAAPYINYRGERFLNLISNNYLGLNNHPLIKQRSKEYIDKYGTSSSGSRLLGGSYEYQKNIETQLASFKQKEAALIFNSGYNANLALASLFAQSGEAVFMDRLNHASLYDGIKLGKGQLVRYQHNDSSNLEELLIKHSHKDKPGVVITESLFSMDGDFALLEEISFLKAKYGFTLIVDEAHAESLYGPQGRGYLFEIETAPAADLILGAFGKGYGAFGAYVAGSQIAINYLINKARSFIYTTALPPAAFGAIEGALEVSKSADDKRQNLIQLSTYLRQNLLVRNYNILNSKSHIIPLIVGSNDLALELTNYLKLNGILVAPIREPSVPKGTARLRVNLCADHNYADVDSFIQALDHWPKKQNLSGWQST